MKTTMILVAMMGLGLATAAPAQEPAALSRPKVKTTTAARPDWTATVGLIGLQYNHGEDALQHRADYDDESRSNWEDGDTDGDGYGLRLYYGRESHAFALTLLWSDYDYDRTDGSDWQSISTERQDIDLQYYRTVEGADDPMATGLWGWALGFRYTDMDKSMQIFEKGGQVTSFGGDNTWKMVQGGYFGHWRPFGWRLKVFGQVNALFGEVDGLSRRGEDTRIDGRISETYEDNQSVAYGLNATAGLSLEVHKHVSLNAGYRREWLYSFDATDSGTVVFPDNDDALFIEDTHSLYAGIVVNF